MKSFSENLVAVMSGVGIRRRWKSEVSPWYNFFDEIELHALLARGGRGARPRAGGGRLPLEARGGRAGARAVAAAALPRPEALRARGEPHARGRGGARSGSEDVDAARDAALSEDARPGSDGRRGRRAAVCGRLGGHGLGSAAPRAIPSSPAAGSAATTSSAATGSIREVLEGERHSIWVLGGAAARQDEPAEGARAPGAAQPRDAVRRRSTGTCRAAATPAGSPRRCSRASRTPRPSAARPTSRSRTWRACRSRRCSRRLVRRTVRSGWRLLLLVDEAEELLVVGRTDPAVLARLRRVISRGPDVRTVITATRLLARDRRGVAAAHLALPAGLHPARLPDAAHRPTRAARCSPAAASRAADVELVLERTALPPVPAAAAREPAVREPRPGRDARPARRGRDDRELLRGGLRHAARGRARPALRGGARGQQDAAPSSRGRSAAPRRTSRRPLYGLSMLGYLARDGDGWRLGNWLFERWLAPARRGRRPARLSR